MRPCSFEHVCERSCSTGHVGAPAARAPARSTVARERYQAFALGLRDAMPAIFVRLGHGPESEEPSRSFLVDVLRDPSLATREALRHARLPARAPSRHVVRARRLTAETLRAPRLAFLVPRRRRRASRVVVHRGVQRRRRRARRPNKKRRSTLLRRGSPRARCRFELRGCEPRQGFPAAVGRVPRAWRAVSRRSDQVVTFDGTAAPSLVVRAQRTHRMRDFTAAAMRPGVSLRPHPAE